MRIVSYNLNGIRSAERKGLIDWLKEDQADIVCLQELKAKEEQINIEAIKDLGFYPYFFSAQKPGYSGVGILSKKEPRHVELGCGHDLYDYEGRVMRADYENVSVISAYLPSGSSGDKRQEIKMEFLEFFYSYIKELLVQKSALVISGDYNICHHPIDIHNPVSNKNSSGFLPEEREWLTRFLELGLYDTFRLMNPEKRDAYSWWSFRANARKNNKGWRIDYNIISEILRSRVLAASILPEIVHSDHCPIVLELKD
jgi:exodeoxyribonuclease-3